jgi:iron-sulfur cluster insertion protein
MQTHENTSTPATGSANGFSLSESAAARINILKSEDGKAALRFRITVKGGGCSGFQYDFTLDDAAPAATDAVFEKNGAEVVIDDISLGMLAGSQLDYTEDLAHAGFVIKNPNATARCGCGNSFSVSL